MHVTTARVSYGDTDQAGVAYHARYLQWFEMGRTELMRDLGFPYARLEAERKLLLTVVEAHLEFPKPARYDDVLVIESAVGELRRVRLRIDTRIRRQAGGELLCTGHVVLACVDRQGKPSAIPDDVREKLGQAIAGAAGKTPGGPASKSGAASRG
jgi:acyl-CoA thioester hydrolase